jgi:hypothetical protein
VGVTWRRGNRSVYLELYNDGAAYAILSDGPDEVGIRPVRTDERSFEALLTEVRGFLDV